MDFFLTKEHELIGKKVREFAEREILPGLRERDRAEEPSRETIEKMGKAGILGTCLPTQYSGGGHDYISLGITCEELERVETSARVALSVHLGLHSLTLLQWGTSEQKKRWLPKLATGERLGGFGLTEPGAGSDVANIETRAIRDGSSYVLDGEKAWIGLADFADQFLVIAVTDPDASRRAHGMSAFIVDRSMAGFHSAPIKHKLGVRTGDVGRLFFDEVRIPIENRIGEEGDGFKVAMSALDHGRYSVAAGAVGIIQACLDDSVAYANSRTVDGEFIGKKQLVQQMIANMVAGRDIGRLLYYRVGWMKNKGIRHTRECSLAKWQNCNAAFQAASDAVQIHGAYGFYDEFPVERYFRNSRGAMIYEGTREVHTLLQAEYELGYRVDKPLKHVLPTWPFAEDV